VVKIEKNVEKKVNINIDHSEPAFFSDSVTVSHNPQKFILDFTQTTPRFDVIIDERQQSFAIKHKTIMLDPVVAKNFVEVLKENVARFEKNFGKIRMPEARKEKSEAADVSDGKYSYIG
jgi:hypothetical protein